MEVLRLDEFIVWSSDDDIVQLEKEIHLSQVELSFYSRIGSESRRREWLLSRIIVRKILGDEVSTAYDGKRPYLVGSDKHLSISHSDKLVVVMISDNVCGIDIENSTKNFSRVSNRFLSSQEREFMTKEDIALAWSIKEAAYKMIGVPDIDFATMFKIKEIDKENGISILTYNNVDYLFNIVRLHNYNIVYGKMR